MSGNKETDAQGTGEERRVRYYISRDSALQVIHIETGDQWENWSLSGHELARSSRRFPLRSLAQFEEIEEARAKHLLEEGARQRRETEETSESPGPTGLGGWLILHTVGLFLSVAVGIAALILFYLFVFQAGRWTEFTTPGTAAYHPAYAPWIVFAMVTCALGTAVSAFLLVFLFQKRNSFPKLMVASLALSFVVAVANCVFELTIAADRFSAGLRFFYDDLVFSRVVLVLGTGVGCALWIGYFLDSKRVKNTFVKRTKAESA